MVVHKVMGLLLQISIDGLSKASETSVVNAILVSIVLILFGGIAYLYKKLEDKNKELTSNTLKLMADHALEIKELQNTAIKREEERSKQWLESEKETLNVLNGVTSILDMAEKMEQSNRNTIYLKLQEMENRILHRIESLEKKK